MRVAAHCVAVVWWYHAPLDAWYPEAIALMMCAVWMWRSGFVSQTAPRLCCSDRQLAQTRSTLSTSRPSPNTPLSGGGREGGLS
jgi:hypothetical protein